MNPSVRKKVAAAVVVAVTSLVTFVGLRSQGPQVPTGQHWDTSAAYEIPATQDIAYRTVAASKTTWGAAASLPDTVDRIHSMLLKHVGEGFVVRSKGGEWGPSRTLHDALTRFSDRLGSVSVGDVLQIRALLDDFMVKATKVDLNPAMVIDTEGTLAVDIIVGTTVTKFPNVVGLGILVCKKIEGTNQWSQHAYANAIDWGSPYDWGSSQSIAFLDAVAKYQQDLIDKGYVPISQLLWRGVPNHYPGHIHDSGAPLMSGTPACAR